MARAHLLFMRRLEVLWKHSTMSTIPPGVIVDQSGTVISLRIVEVKSTGGDVCVKAGRAAQKSQCT